MAMARLTCCLVLVASWTELAPGLVFKCFLPKLGPCVF